MYNEVRVTGKDDKRRSRNEGRQVGRQAGKQDIEIEAK